MQATAAISELQSRGALAAGFLQSPRFAGCCIAGCDKDRLDSTSGYVFQPAELQASLTLAALPRRPWNPARTRLRLLRRLSKLRILAEHEAGFQTGFLVALGASIIKVIPDNACLDL